MTSSPPDPDPRDDATPDDSIDAAAVDAPDADEDESLLERLFDADLEIIFDDEPPDEE